MAKKSKKQPKKPWILPFSFSLDLNPDRMIAGGWREYVPGSGIFYGHYIPKEERESAVQRCVHV